MIKKYLLSTACFYFMILCGLYSQTNKTIGFLIDDFNSTRWVKDTFYFVKHAEKKGYKTIVKHCDSDTAMQFNQAKQLISQGVKVLVIVAADANAAKSIVDYAHKKHVSVVAYDRLIPHPDLDYYLSFDAIKVGELQALHVLKKINYQGNIVILNGPKNDINSLLFAQGHMNILKPYIDKGQIKVVYNHHLSEWTSLEASMRMMDFLGTYKDEIHAAIAANDELASGFIDAWKIFHESKRIPVTGQDAMPIACTNILSGEQTMTVFKPLNELAMEAVKVAINILERKNVSLPDYSLVEGNRIPTLKIAPIAVDKDNLYHTLITSGYYGKDEIIFTEKNKH
ncbi:MAG: substrate-binding domain-containing protein [Cytophagaceae bacterium]|nr:substrate-binding domain-containing protein [Cytophagaceae bacterium]MDW8456141.1 substrate-binding domain-containing protein [Cytophagaceae bacterium]